LKRLLFLYINFLFFSANSLAQENISESFSTHKKNDSIKVHWDKKYREDQFYIGLTHNIFLNKPDAVDQNALSIGVGTGFLRDFPISENRRFAIAPGIGLGYLRINSFVIPDLNGVSNGYSKININQFLVEAPLELRWRNSTLESHVFFRVHLGAKFSYNLYNTYTLTNHPNAENIDFTNQDNLTRYTFQNYLAFGYNTWTAYFAYTHTPFYKNESYSNQNLKSNLLSFGFIFYIL